MKYMLLIHCYMKYMLLIHCYMKYMLLIHCYMKLQTKTTILLIISFHYTKVYLVCNYIFSLYKGLSSV